MRRNETRLAVDLLDDLMPVDSGGTVESTTGQWTTEIGMLARDIRGWGTVRVPKRYSRFDGSHDIEHLPSNIQRQTPIMKPICNNNGSVKRHCLSIDVGCQGPMFRGSNHLLKGSLSLT